MGGCIAVKIGPQAVSTVSSLYGRVYRTVNTSSSTLRCFLPVWEGVSDSFTELLKLCLFPPCMGGWIVEQKKEKEKISCFLPVWEGGSAPIEPPITASKFPPCMRGCIAFIQRVRKAKNVSSLYGRV